MGAIGNVCKNLGNGAGRMAKTTGNMKRLMHSSASNLEVGAKNTPILAECLNVSKGNNVALNAGIVGLSLLPGAGSGLKVNKLAGTISP
jgi:hypothetical protein